LPNAESVARRCLSLPIFPELDDERIDRICGAVREALDG
ncbi:MAG: DegT/DnrJ/EryC1/StrS family aminotransferase, partial [Halofilum sp. (in: g-proteobacteria)]|nr:DegT/DnrJ/EryC1/StrS family aminotransferase [Halofilum sp. (in: g-proteobacteria)]